MHPAEELTGERKICEVVADEQHNERGTLLNSCEPSRTGLG